MFFTVQRILLLLFVQHGNWQLFRPVYKNTLSIHVTCTAVARLLRFFARCLPRFRRAGKDGTKGREPEGRVGAAGHAGALGTGERGNRRGRSRGRVMVLFIVLMVFAGCGLPGVAARVHRELDGSALQEDAIDRTPRASTQEKLLGRVRYF